MELHLTPEQEANIHLIARHEGKTPEELIVGAFLNVSDYDLPTQNILRQRTHLADQGAFLEEDEMDTRFRTMWNR